MLVETIIRNNKIVEKRNIFNATLEDMIKKIEADRPYIALIDRGRTYIVAEYMNGKIRIIEEL